MRWIFEHNLEVMTGVFAATTVLLVAFWGQLDMPHRLVLMFAAIITLHEWEETRFPGGFMKIMTGKLQVDASGVPAWKLHIYQACYIVILIALPFIFPQVRWLCAVPFFLGVFEGFIHIAGIKIMGLEKPYSPGMVTAIIMAVPSIYGIWYLAANGLVTGLDWLWALLLFVAEFALMQQLLLRTVLGLRNVREKMKLIIGSK